MKVLLVGLFAFGLADLFGWLELPLAIAVVSCESLVGLFGKHPFRRVARLWLKKWRQNRQLKTCLESYSASWLSQKREKVVCLTFAIHLKNADAVSSSQERQSADRTDPCQIQGVPKS